MGESVLYAQYQQQMQNENQLTLYSSMQDTVTFVAFMFITLAVVTLAANGVFKGITSAGNNLVE